MTDTRSTPQGEPSHEQMLALAERIQREVHEDGVKLDLVRRASMRWTSDEYDLARALLRTRSESGRRLTQRQKNAIREAIGFRLSGESDDVDREALEGALENL